MKETIQKLIIACLLLVATMPAQPANGIFGGGNGSPATPYIIEDAADLNAVRNDLTAHYKLANDINLTEYIVQNYSSTGWLPIGDNYTDNKNTRFTGSFNGDGHKITGLQINRSVFGINIDYAGLFGYATDATIESLGIENCDITGSYAVGGLVGYNYNSTIQNCYATGRVNGNSYVGGLVGYNDNNSTIQNCYTTGNVNGKNNNAGGLVGCNDNNSTIQNCHITGNVNGNDYVGGLVGYNDNNSIIQNCYTTGNVNGNDYVGGSVGYNDNNSTIQNCYTTDNIIGNNAAGGLVGYNDNNSIIENCYATGNIIGNKYVGGLAGYNHESTIKNSVAANVSVTATSKTEYINRITGYNGTNSTLSNNYALEDIIVAADGSPVTITPSANAEDGANKTLSELQSLKFYTTLSSSTVVWDFSTIWQIWEGKSYPYFPNQSAPVYNPIANGKTISFELRNPVDSVIIYNVSQGVSETIYPESLLLELSISALSYLNTIQVGDILRFIVYETDKMPAYPVETKYDLFCGGDGSSGNPYLICKPAHLDYVRNHLDKHYNLANDIDLTEYIAQNYSSAGWLPIGNIDTAFTGYFNGAGHKITGLWIKRSGNDRIALFGFTSKANINNLGIENCDITGFQTVGGLVGYNVNSTIQNCYVTGNVNGNNYVGGLVGFNENNSIIQNCYVTGNVNGNNAVGGLVGYCFVASNVKNCYATGNVNGNNTVGGLVGYNESNSIIQHCYATVKVKGNSTVGGLAGYCHFASNIENCYAAGNVSGTTRVGGLVGHNYESTIKNSVAANGSVTATSKTEDINRITGYNDSNSTLSNNYALADMIVTADGSPVTITSSANGLAGANKALSELQSLEFYTTLSSSTVLWDFTTIWQIWEGKSYPYFPNQSAPVYNPIANGKTISFELRNPVDSVIIYNVSQGVSETIYPAFLSLELSISSLSYLNTIQVGDILRFIVYETGKMPAYTVETKYDLFCGGDGSNGSPYLICKPEQLDYVRNHLDKHYKLANDIDLTEYIAQNYSSAGWLPIGNIGTAFTGSFNGAGHKITGLRIDRNGEDYIGLFGHINGVTIENLSIENCDVKGYNTVGGLAGLAGFNFDNSNFIKNCYLTGNVSGTGQYVGGLVGYNANSIIKNCYATANVTGDETVGGLVGYNNDSGIQNCYTTGNVNATAYDVGGLVGFNQSSAIENSYATGNVSGSTRVGGLAGYNTNGSTIKHSVAANKLLTATDEYSIAINRITGYNNATLTNNYALEDLIVVVDGTPVDISAGIDDAGVDKSLSELQSLTFYTNSLVAWDFATIWGIYENYGYPYLKSFNNDIIIIPTGSGKPYDGEPASTPVDYTVISDNPLVDCMDAANQLTGELAYSGSDPTFTEIGEYAIVQNTLTNPNYQISFKNDVNYGITLRPITITANDEDIEFGATPELTYEITSGSLLIGDALSGELYVKLEGTELSPPYDNLAVGTYIITQGTLTAGKNYEITFEEGILKVGTTSISYITIDKTGITAWPNPVSLGETIYLQTNLSEEQLKNAVIEIYNAAGICVEKLPAASLRIVVNPQLAPGVYSVTLKCEDGMKKNVKILIRQGGFR